ncbi:MAG TPA: Asp-tRNA(Asn)/Glu-tRNA(Gln) amidotransferase subunit GatC [Terriglobia bacterium]
MSLTEKEVRYVAELAHLKLTEGEVREFLPQLDSVLEYMAKLNELDIKDVEPMAQVLAQGSADFAMRLDSARKTFSPDEALSNAPERGDDLFKVPRVIDRE